MTERPEDHPLRERFLDARAETRASGVPDFGTMLERARAEAPGAPQLGVADGSVVGGVAGGPGGGARRRPASRRRLVLAGAWTSAALAATVAGLLLTGRATGGEDEDFERLVAAYTSDLAPGAWRSPTSGLLQVPGMELLRTVPSIGGSVRGAAPATPTAGGEPPRDEIR
jgi:hypothetical protein